MAFAGARPGVLSSAARTAGLSAGLAAACPSALRLAAPPRAKELTVNTQFAGLRDRYLSSAAGLPAPRLSSARHHAAAPRAARVTTMAAAPFDDLRAGIFSPTVAVGGNAAGLASARPSSLPVLRPATRSARTRTLMVAQCMGEESSASLRDPRTPPSIFQKSLMVAQCMGEESSASLRDPRTPPSIFQKSLIIWSNMCIWAGKHIPDVILPVFCLWIGSLTLNGEKGALDLVSVCEKAYKVYKLLSKALPILSDFFRIFR